MPESDFGLMGEQLAELKILPLVFVPVRDTRLRSVLPRQVLQLFSDRLVYP